MFLRRAFPTGIHINLLASSSSGESTDFLGRNGDYNAQPGFEEDSDRAMEEGELEEGILDEEALEEGGWDEGELPELEDIEDSTLAVKDKAPHSFLVDSQSRDSAGDSMNVASPLSYDSDIISNPWYSVPEERKPFTEDQATTSAAPASPDHRKILLAPILKRNSSSPTEPTSNGEIDSKDQRKLLLSPLLRRSANNSPVEVDNKTQNVDEPEPKLRTRRSTSSFPAFLHKIAESSKPTGSASELTTPSKPSTSTSSSSFSPIPAEENDNENDDVSKRRRRPTRRTNNSFPILHPIVESDSMNTDTVPTSSKSGSSFTLASSSAFAKKMEEAGRLRRLQSQSQVLVTPDPPTASTPPPPPPPPPEPFQNDQLNKDKASAISDDKSDSESDLAQKLDDTTASTTPNLSDVPELISRSQLEQLKAKDDELDALHNALQQALTELEDAREENIRAIAQSNEEKRRLTQQVKSSIEEAATLRRENLSMQQKVTTLQSQLNKSETELQALKKDKQGWQGQLDAMRERVNQADKQIRCLDGLTHSKLEAKMEGAFGPTRRSQKAANKDPSAEVVNAVVCLNDEIMQAASLLVENIERVKGTNVPSTAVSRAKTIFGKKMLGLLEAQAINNSSGFRFLLTQAALEAFMVHWSMNIIEAWYPVRQTFADLLVDLAASQASSSKSPIVANAKVECGKVKIVDTTPSATVKFPEWVTDILKDLTLILSLAGLRMRPNRSAVFTSKFLLVVNLAYNVRTALAEKDICGGLEACAVSGDMPFQPKSMDEAYFSNRLKSSSNMEAELIASTSAIGLQRLTTDSHNKPVTTMVLKPKVVLVRVLEESP